VNIREAYNIWSKTYESSTNRTRDLDQQLMQESLKDKNFNSVLEIGCGTGKNTALLSMISRQVLAIDFSEEMLRIASSKADNENVEFKLADVMQKWPVADNSIDLVCSNLVLEHLESLSFAFSEASRVLKGEGCYFVSELHPFRQYQGTQAHFELDGTTTNVQAFLHNISDYLESAAESKLSLLELKEWWHPEDCKQIPRILSLMFSKQS
jgi:ubiquinone/menaquinone biosynthesis C-methylase UbiE